MHPLPLKHGVSFCQLLRLILFQSHPRQHGFTDCPDVHMPVCLLAPWRKNRTPRGGHDFARVFCCQYDDSRWR